MNDVRTSLEEVDDMAYLFGFVESVKTLESVGV